jgi:hypothetical protein
MEFLVEFEVNVPIGVPEDARRLDARDGHAARTSSERPGRRRGHG